MFGVLNARVQCGQCLLLHVPSGVRIEDGFVRVEKLVRRGDREEAVSQTVDLGLGTIPLVAEKTEYSDVLLQLVTVGLDRGDEA